MPKRKETIVIPNRKELRQGSQDLRRGRSDGARVMAEKSVAVRQSKKK